MKVKNIATRMNRKQLKSLVLNLNAKLEQVSSCSADKDKQIGELEVKQQQLIAENINLHDKLSLREKAIEVKDNEIARLNVLAGELMAQNSKMKDEANKPLWKKVVKCFTK